MTARLKSCPFACYHWEDVCRWRRENGATGAMMGTSPLWSALALPALCPGGLPKARREQRLPHSKNVLAEQLTAKMAVPQPVAGLLDTRASAAPVECYLFPVTCSLRNGTPGRARTCDLLLRRQPLYPTELQAHAEVSLLPRPGTVKFDGDESQEDAQEAFSHVIVSPLLIILSGAKGLGTWLRANSAKNLAQNS